MTKFNQVWAAATRAADPNLTPYDTGEVLQPKPWPIGAFQDDHPDGENGYVTSFGKVDFDNNEGGTDFTVFAHPSAVEDDTTLVQIDTLAGGRFKIMLNEGMIFNGSPEEKTGVERILDAYDSIEEGWVASGPDEDSDDVRHPRDYEDHDDDLTRLLHELVSAIRSERTE